MESPSRCGNSSPDPMRARVRLLHFHAFDVAPVIADNGIESAGILDGKEHKVHARPLLHGGVKSVFRKPDGIRKADQHRLFRMAVYEPKREAVVFANVASHNNGPLPDEELATIYTAILAAMRRLQSPDILERS